MKLAAVASVMSSERRVVVLLIDRLLTLGARAWGIATRPAWKVSHTVRRLEKVRTVCTQNVLVGARNRLSFDIVHLLHDSIDFIECRLHPWVIASVQALGQVVGPERFRQGSR